MHQKLDDEVVLYVVLIFVRCRASDVEASGAGRIIQRRSLSGEAVASRL
ncbi:hypothetical protein NYV46_26970 [Escherichia coli]|nr:hypothetical protein [Escherichia coli]